MQTLRENGFKSLDYPGYDKAPIELYYSRNSYHFAYSDTVIDESSFAFIKRLINNQYYQEALLEIMRIEFELKKFNLELFVNKIICLKALEEYEKAFNIGKLGIDIEIDDTFMTEFQIYDYKYKDDMVYVCIKNKKYGIGVKLSLELLKNNKLDKEDIDRIKENLDECLINLVKNDL
jgi:hypothetical protein